MEGPRYDAVDCDRADGRGGGGGNVPQAFYPHIRMGEGVAREGGVAEARPSVCDRGGVVEARNLYTTASSPASSSHAPGISTNGPAVAPRVMSLSDRRASLELRCLGMPVGRPSIPSGLVISKVNAAGPSRQEVPVKDISRVDGHRRNSEEMAVPEKLSLEANPQRDRKNHRLIQTERSDGDLHSNDGGCDLAIASKERTPTIPQPTTMGPPSSPLRSPTNRPMGSHNGDAPVHRGSPHLSSPHIVALGDPSSVAPVARARVGMSPPSGGRISIGDGVIISRATVDAASLLSTGLGGREMASPGRRNGDVALVEKQERQNHVTKPEAMSSPQRAVPRSPVAPVEGGILSRMLGHGILTNGEITLTPRSRPPQKEEVVPRPQGVKRGAEEMPGAHGPREKQTAMEPVSLVERGGVPMEMRGNPRGLSIEMRSPKAMDATPSPAVPRNSNGFRMKEITAGRDEITIEPVMDPNRRAYEMQREQQYLSPERKLTESFASRYPLLREGLSKPCLRRRGRPPKMALQAVGRARRYMGEVIPDYTVYHTAHAQLSGGLNLPEGTVVSPLVSQQPRKSMSIDEVLSYYGSMQERKAMGAEAEVHRPQQQPRGESTVPSNPETSMAAMQNSSLAQIESMVQSQIPSTTGFYPSGMPRYPYLPNPTPSMPTVPGYAAQMGPYTGQHMLMPGVGYHGIGYRGRGRPRGRSRGRGRPRGMSGLYYHGTERDLLPKPDYMPRHTEDVEEIVVEVDFKPEWDDEREVEIAKEDSLSEAQKLVPNWISVVPAKLSQGRSRSDNTINATRSSAIGGNISHTPELTIRESRGPAATVSQRPVVVPEEVEICPSVEDVLGQTKENIPREASAAEAEAEEVNTPSETQPEVHPLSAPEKPEEPPEPVVDEPEKTASEPEVIQELPPAETADVAETVEASKEIEDDVVVVEDSETGETEEVEQAKDIEGPSEKAAESEVLHVKTEVVEGDLDQEVVTGGAGGGRGEEEEVEGAVVQRRRSSRERKERNSQLASSLASIKSLPKDVTVVRSRTNDSSFSKGRQRAAFPESVAAQLGPSIEIRRVRASQRSAAARDRASSKGGAEVAVGDLKAVVEKEEVEEAELLARIPALSKILSMGSSMKPEASSDKSEKSEGGDGVGDGLVAKVKEEPDVYSDMEPIFGVTDEEEEQEDDQDETYRPAGYRGAGRRRRGRGRRGSATRVDSVQQPQPRQRRVARRKRTRVKVKVEEEERPGDWDVFVCDLCGRSFSKRFRLAHHIRAYHPMPTEGDDSSRRVFPCQECSKAFTRKANLKKHMRIHTGEKPFVCEECGRAFTFSKNLAQHRRVHGVERPFVCEVCGHAFRFSKNLSQHRGVHAHLKPHVCSVCGRGFSRSTHLSQHKRLHSGEKPFRCSVCGKRFAQRGHAALHTRIHTGERPYACPVCGRAFSLRAHLVRHVALHQRDGEMGPGRPPPLPRRDRRGRDGVEVVGAEEEEGGEGGMGVAEEEGGGVMVQEEEEGVEGYEGEEYYGEEEEEGYLEEEGEELGEEGEGMPFEGVLGEEEEEAYAEEQCEEGGYEEEAPLDEAGGAEVEEAMEEGTPGDGSVVAVSEEGQQDQDVITAA